jgi:hypothetical protein
LIKSPKNKKEAKEINSFTREVEKFCVSLHLRLSSGYKDYKEISILSQLENIGLKKKNWLNEILQDYEIFGIEPECGRTKEVMYMVKFKLLNGDMQALDRLST